MNKHLHTWLITAITVIASLCATAQGAPQQPEQSPDTAHSPITISLVTFYPGDEPFSIYGHTELRVQQAGAGDLYYNYGVFDFNAPGFVFRFVTGDALYYCVPIPAQYATIGMEGRRMVEQQLNLTQEQARRVDAFLRNNAKTENRTYQYRYLTNNCSTKPRDIIEMAVSTDSLSYARPAESTTYRKMMAHYGKNYAWQQFGIDLVLGSELDKPLDYRRQMFVPMVLMQALDGATIKRNGHTEPLVSQTQVMVDGDEQGLVLPPTPWWCSPMAVALLILAIAVCITIKDLKQRRVTRWFDATFYCILGIAGCVIAFLVTCSQHEALWPNYNLLWVHPLALIAAIASLMPRKAGKVLTCFHSVNAAVIAYTLGAWYFMPQVANAAFFPLMATSLLRSASFIIIKKK